MDVLGYFLMFVCGVALTSTFFLKRRNEPANTGPIDQLKSQILTLQGRVHILENKKLSKVELAEFSDAIKQVMRDHESMKKALGDAVINFNMARMNLTVRGRAKREKEIRA